MAIMTDPVMGWDSLGLRALTWIYGEAVFSCVSSGTDCMQNQDDAGSRALLLQPMAKYRRSVFEPCNSQILEKHEIIYQMEAVLPPYRPHSKCSNMVEFAVQHQRIKLCVCFTTQNDLAGCP